VSNFKIPRDKPLLLPMLIPLGRYFSVTVLMKDIFMSIGLFGFVHAKRNCRINNVTLGAVW